MLRCERCRGHANAALAHIHGLHEHLCAQCTRDVVQAHPPQKREVKPLTRPAMVPTVFIGHVTKEAA